MSRSNIFFSNLKSALMIGQITSSNSESESEKKSLNQVKMRGVAAFHSKDDNFCHQMAKKRAENSLFFLFQYYCPIL